MGLLRKLLGLIVPARGREADRKNTEEFRRLMREKSDPETRRQREQALKERVMDLSGRGPLGLGAAPSAPEPLIGTGRQISPDGVYLPLNARVSRAALDEWEENLTVVWAGWTPRVDFTYEKDNGERSTRSVDVNQAMRGQRRALYIQGYCHLRNERRTFRVSRIVGRRVIVNGRSYSTGQWAREFLGLG